MVHASFAPLRFAGQEFLAHGSGALLWPAQAALLVADLHLEKGSFYARFGQMLPPYDSEATLRALAALVDASGVMRLWCLGDAFHDSAGEERLGGAAEELLRGLCGRVQWTWIAGNHDAALTGRCGGRVVASDSVAGLSLTHIASRRPGPELSGHFHPRIVLSGAARRLTRRCFLRSQDRLILPAFGSLTAGLAPDHPEIARLFGDSGYDALVPIDGRLLAFPLRQGRAADPQRASA